MFDFFVKKQYLTDYLENFIDVHNHILPGIDDGAKTTEDSLDLIRGFSELGITNFVATPHIMHNYYPNNPETIGNALSELKSAMLGAGILDVAIDTAAEHMIDDNFEALLDTGGVMPLKKSHILVEMSFLQPSINFDEAMIKIVRNHLYPVLAHPERYGFLNQKPRKYRVYKNQGILFQLNLLSLANYYDKEIQKAAHKLLEDGLIDFVASDVHRTEHLEAIKEVTLSKKTINALLPVINNTIEVFM